MNAAVIAKYHQLRQDHISLYRGTGARYHHKVPASRALDIARRHVDITTRWEKAEAAGLVRLTLEPDIDADLADLAGDCFNPDANPTIQPHILEREYQEFVDRVNRDGVWGVIGEYKCPCCDHWTVADSCWGFVGDDWQESGYDLDIMHATLSQLT